VLTKELARQLRSAGLVWRPVSGDRFHIPDRHLDDSVFFIADLTVDVVTLADGIGAITFNGAVEWSQDYILTQDVVWLPTETQLRQALSDSFRSFVRTESGYRCDIETDRGVLGFEAATPSDAYASALLAVLDPAVMGAVT
jgi:hypothetical protein